MHVISRKCLSRFWKVHADAEVPLRAWYKVATTADWEKFAGVRAGFPAADQVGRFTVFNIGGNKYRLIAAIHFNRGMVFVRQVLTHSDDNKGSWKDG